MQSFIDFGQGQVPWLDFSDSGSSPPQTDAEQNANKPPIHFSPANGIPVASYAEFFACFSDSYSISGMDFRGGWPNQALPKNSYSWQDHADDLIAAIETQYTQKVIGMGHSIGGSVTLLAAVKRPDLFKALVIIEAASMPFNIPAFFWQLVPQWLVFKAVPFIKGTHYRQRIWESRQAFIDNYRDHPTYRLFTDRALRDYANFGLRETTNGQFELSHNPAWESFNFRRVVYPWNALSKIRHDTLLLRAGNTYMYSQQEFDKRNRGLAKNITAQTVPEAHHLLTHEVPETTAEQIRHWLD